MAKRELDKAQELSQRIQPLLKGQGEMVQAAVLADLMSLWLAGHWPPEQRHVLLMRWVKLVQDLVPISEEQLFGPEGHPGAKAEWTDCTP